MPFSCVTVQIVQCGYSFHLHRVSKKLCKLIFCQNFVKFRPIAKIFGTKIAQRTSFSEVYLCLRVYVFFMFFCTVILTELSMFCMRLSHFIIKFDWLKSRSRIHDIRRPDGSFASNNDEKAKIFNDFFASVFTADNGTVPQFSTRVAPHICLDSIRFLTYHCVYKKAVLSQIWPRNAPYIWVPWKFSGLPNYAHGNYSQHFSRAFVRIDPLNVPTKFEVHSFIRSSDNRGVAQKFGQSLDTPSLPFLQHFK